MRSPAAGSCASEQHTWPAETVGLTVIGPSHICAAVLMGGTVTLDVTQQEGNVVAYPQLVTSDYARRYTIHIELSGNNASCGTVSFVADVEVEQAAKDVVAHPENVCWCL